MKLRQLIEQCEFEANVKMKLRQLCCETVRGVMVRAAVWALSIGWNVLRGAAQND